MKNAVGTEHVGICSMTVHSEHNEHVCITTRSKGSVCAKKVRVTGWLRDEIIQNDLIGTLQYCKTFPYMY